MIRMRARVVRRHVRHGEIRTRLMAPSYHIGSGEKGRIHRRKPGAPPPVFAPASPAPWRVPWRRGGSSSTKAAPVREKTAEHGPATKPMRQITSGGMTGVHAAVRGEVGRKADHLQGDAGEEGAEPRGGLGGEGPPGVIEPPSRRLWNSTSCSSAASAIIEAKAMPAVESITPPTKASAESSAVRGPCCNGSSPSSRAPGGPTWVATRPNKPMTTVVRFSSFPTTGGHQRRAQDQPGERRQGGQLNLVRRQRPGRRCWRGRSSRLIEREPREEEDRRGEQHPEWTDCRTLL